jgi:hypothetical protein
MRGFGDVGKFIGTSRGFYGKSLAFLRFYWIPQIPQITKFPSLIHSHQTTIFIIISLQKTSSFNYSKLVFPNEFQTRFLLNIFPHFLSKFDKFSISGFY